MRSPTLIVMMSSLESSTSVLDGRRNDTACRHRSPIASARGLGRTGLETPLRLPILGCIRAAAPDPFSERPMAVTRYYPWTQPNRLQNEIKQVFDRFFG